jgi:uncharacterized protein YbjT (DUF2867 family)
MKIMVIGGTGTVGSQVVRELATRKAEVSVLTRSADKAKSLPPGVKGVTGDLLDPATVRSAFKGMDGVFLLNAVSVSEAQEGLMAVNGICMAGVKRLVYMSVHHADRAPYVPHFGAKLPIEEAIKTCGMRYTILRPCGFFQNDHWFKEPLLERGVYPQPVGEIGLSRVDVRDIAEAAAICLTRDGHEGRTYDLVGPEVQNGDATAQAWSRALNRKIVYGGNDLDTWEKQALRQAPPWLAFDLRLMYAFIQEEGMKGTAADVQRVTQLLGHPPRSFDDFARETAKMWRG